MSNAIRLIVVCAHPDEADEYAGGTAALFAELGHAVKFFALTNGDAGHFREGGGPLAARRTAEAAEAGKRLGVAYDVVQEHDGELFPTLDVRRQVIRSIREWQADIVIGFHPDGGGHPDNRNAGKAVRDAIAFVANPNIIGRYPAATLSSAVSVHDRLRDPADPSTSPGDLRLIRQSTKSCAPGMPTQPSSMSLRHGAEVCWTRFPSPWPDKRAFLLEYWAEFAYASAEMRPALERWYGADHAAEVEFAELFQFASRDVPSD